MVLKLASQINELSHRVFHTSFVPLSPLVCCLSLSLQLALFFPPFLLLPLFLFTICQQKK